MVERNVNVFDGGSGGNVRDDLANKLDSLPILSSLKGVNILGEAKDAAVNSAEGALDKAKGAVASIGDLKPTSTPDVPPPTQGRSAPERTPEVQQEVSPHHVDMCEIGDFSPTCPNLNGGGRSFGGRA